MVAGSACGGGDKVAGGKPEKGSPADTGDSPNCSTVPLELAEEKLKLDLEGPSQNERPSGFSCVFRRPGGGAGAVETVLFTGNESEEGFKIIRDGYEKANIKISNIKGWGDEAYAVNVRTYVQQNTFAVLKGRVSVIITSTAGFDEIRKLMKPVLEKVVSAPA